MSLKEPPALQNLVVGDIFHAYFTESPESKRPSLICLITSVTDGAILARTIATQVRFAFDRKTGYSRSFEPPIYESSIGEPLVAVIDSIAPLPSRIYNALLSLDRHSRLAHFSTDLEKRILTDEHREALLFAAKFYPDNPL